MRHRSDVAVALRIALVLFLGFSLFTSGQLKSTDEIGVFETTASLFERGELSVPRLPHSYPGRGGRFHHQYVVGAPVLGLPFFGIGRLLSNVLPDGVRRALAGERLETGVLRFGGSVEIFATTFISPLVSALLVATFFLLARDFDASPRAALVSSLLLAATTHVGMMSTFYLRHPLEALCILGAFLGFYRYKQEGRRFDLGLGATAASAILLVRMPAALAGLTLGGYLLHCLWVRREPLGRTAPVIALPLALVLCISVGVNWIKWGTPFDSPILQWTQGNLSGDLSVSLPAYLVSPGHSIFVYSPLLLLLPLTLVPFFRRHRAEAIAFLALALSFLIAFSKWQYWAGLFACPGPRYFFAALPLLMLPLANWLDQGTWRLRLGAVAVLGTAGAIVQLLLVTSDWSTMAAFMNWWPEALEKTFLFEADRTPLAGAVLMLKERGPHLWLVRVAGGWPGFQGQPVMAMAVFLAWAVAFGFAVRGLRRELRGQAS